MIGFADGFAEVRIDCLLNRMMAADQSQSVGVDCKHFSVADVKRFIIPRKGCPTGRVADVVILSQWIRNGILLAIPEMQWARERLLCACEQSSDGQRCDSQQ